MIAYLGIDPGQTGALAIIHEPSGVVEVHDYREGSALLALATLADSHWYRDIYCMLEAVHSTPQMGAVSAFKFGANFGRWEGRLEGLGLSYDYTSPAAWQKAMFKGMPKKWINKRVKLKGGVVRNKKIQNTKHMSLQRARQLFPSIQDRITRQHDHGRTDALLIAEFCRRTRKGEL